jgi:26S proteasome regulatory subunit N7
MFLKARFQAKIGDWNEAEKTYDEILVKPKTVTGRKIDAHMEKARIAFFSLDTNKLKTAIDEAKRLNEIGGDWDRRNRLKIYESLYLMSVHDLKAAAALLLDCVATFSCTELLDYNQFSFFTLVSNIIYLDRNDLRKKIINDPHVITVIRELPATQKLVNSIYNCDYQSFFDAVSFGK